MSDTPIFDNYNEITSLVKLIKPNLDPNIHFTPKKLEEKMKGIFNILKCSIPGIHDPTMLTKVSGGFNGVVYLEGNNSNYSSTTNTPNSSNHSDRYISKNEHIIHSNPLIQNIIKKQSGNTENYYCKLH
ncbi:hypothetical protein PIROE2DRAFT_2261 [Piromyces sp. E2]|nr:hypothetical protein PIROE2DRAFT_2261 [Piromyces sp. E2]|eukprot:OUM69829.1 hypothetical protein PIROE2DRAFT_2261 [Piromyces sp. E2]